MFSALATAAIPSLIGAATSAYGAKDQMSQASQMKAQADYSAKAFKQSLVEGPSWEMAGLKKAGINPLLRYGTGGSAAPTYAANVSSTPVNPLEGAAGHLANAGTSAVSALKGLEETKKVTAEIDKIGEDILTLQTQRDLTREQINHEQVKIQNTFADTVYKWTMDALGKEQAELVRSQIMNTEADTLVKRLNAEMLEKGATLSQIGLGFILDTLGIAFRAGESITNAPAAAVGVNNRISGWLRQQLGLEPF